MAAGDETFKLPMRIWLCDLVDKAQIRGLEWYDQEKRHIKVPWAKRHEPGWENCEEVVTEWAKHQHREEKKGVRSDFSTLKANFRNAIHKSEDFTEVKELSQLDRQTGNFKVYRLFTRAEVEQKKLEKKQEGRKRKTAAKSPSTGKLLCSPHNYDDGMLKDVPEKDLNLPLDTTQSLIAADLLELQNVNFAAASGNNIASPVYHQQTTNGTTFQDQDFENMYPSTTTVPTPCTSDGSLVDPLSQIIQDHGIHPCTGDITATGFLHSQKVDAESLLKAFDVKINDIRRCRLTVTYNSGQVLDNELRDTFPGYRLHYGDEKDLKQALEYHQHGRQVSEIDPNDFKYQSVRLPNPKSEYTHLQGILNVTELGLTFRYDPASYSFYMKRLCQSQIFYLDPHTRMGCQQPIKIERNQEICIFSYERFLQSVSKAIQEGNCNHLALYPMLQLSIGSKSNLELQNPSPRGIKVTIYICCLKGFFEENDINGELSIKLSTPNEMEQILHRLKNMRMDTN